MARRCVAGCALDETSPAVVVHASPPGHPMPPAVELPRDSSLTFTTKLSHWLQCAELEELASAAREFEFCALARSFAAKRAKNAEAETLWRAVAFHAISMVQRLEKESELRRVRRKAVKDARALAAGDMPRDVAPFVELATENEEQRAERQACVR